MTTKTVLVTGAYGFIGRYVARCFGEKGWRVAGLGHGSWTPEERQPWHISDWHSCDVTMETLITYAGEPDVFVHCAGSGSVGFSVSHPHQDFQRTVETTIQSLEFLRLYLPRTKFIYPSSAGVYGIAPIFPIKEDSVLAPVSPYGVHKKIAEELIQSYSAQFGIRSAIIRLFSVYGEGLRKQLLWDACNRIKSGENSFYGTGNETRDMLHVNDAASLLYHVTDHASQECPVFNGGMGKGISIRDILQEVYNCFSVSNQPIFTGESKRGDPIHYEADTSRTLALGWQPTVNWRSGIKNYVKWFKSGDRS